MAVDADTLNNAARSGSLELVKYLVKKEADFNAVDDIGNTPLHYAAESGNLELVKYLIEGKKAKVNVDTFNQAVRSRSLELVKYLVEEEGANVNSLDSLRDNCLHEAAKRKSLKLIKYLIKQGAKVDVVDRFNQTPLYHAAGSVDPGSRNLDIVRYLVKKGADINAVDKDGNTPLHSAAESGKLDVIRYLVDERSANVNVRDYAKKTPLHYAVNQGHLDVVKYLVEKGADLNAVDKDGKKPLKIAESTFFKDQEIIDYLRKAMAMPK